MHRDPCPLCGDADCRPEDAQGPKQILFEEWGGHDGPLPEGAAPGEMREITEFVQVGSSGSGYRRTKLVRDDVADADPPRKPRRRRRDGLSGEPSADNGR